MRIPSTGQRVALVATSFALVGTYLAIGVGASALPVTPAASLVLATHNAEAGKWVHEQVNINEGQLAIVENNDISTNFGRQEMGENINATETLIALVGAKRLYERGNVIGVSQYFGIPRAQAGAYANRWLLITPASANYASVAFETTLASDFSNQLKITGPFKFGPPTSIAGVRVRTITGTIPATSSMPLLAVALSITVSGIVRPVRLREIGTGFSLVETWSKWGVPFKLVPPSGAVPFPHVTSTTTTITPSSYGGNTVTSSPIPTIGNNGAGTNPSSVPVP